MDITLAISVLTSILGVIPDLGISSSTVVGKFVAMIEAFLPLVTQEATALAPIVSNVVAALTNTGAATPAQLASLQAIDAQCDAAFEAAATAAGAAPDTTS